MKHEFFWKKWQKVVAIIATIILVPFPFNIIVGAIVWRWLFDIEYAIKGVVAQLERKLKEQQDKVEKDEKEVVDILKVDRIDVDHIKVDTIEVDLEPHFIEEVWKKFIYIVEHTCTKEERKDLVENEIKFDKTGNEDVLNEWRYILNRFFDN